MRSFDKIIDGNEAAASIAYRGSEVIAIYPITPASPMGELCDGWAQAGTPNLWGCVPEVIEMQSEAGAAGVLHGALQGGALATTFTSSQGLLLMIPEMYKIAGELTPAVIHVAARAVATHALSIFGDHSDVMATRATGWAMLCSASVQEAHDLALVVHAATLETRIPFLHFFDGFRTSHEIATISLLDDSVLRELLADDYRLAHRERGLRPDHPVLRGTAQNPDVFFQAREATNPFYDTIPTCLERVFETLSLCCGRRYRLYEYEGPDDAERVICIMGSGTTSVKRAARWLHDRREKVGVLQIRMYRPFCARRFCDALPKSVRKIAVLDRTKEPGSLGEPLFLDVTAAISEGWPSGNRPIVFGGRFGLGSKEFTPEMARRVFTELARETPKRRFTIGIRDDVSGLSLDGDDFPLIEDEGVTEIVLFGLGSDGTVGAAKSLVKIVGEETSHHAQGYFVYDSKKAGSVTVSHLRFSQRPIEASHLIRRAHFVAIHQHSFLEKLDPLEVARPGAKVLLNSPFSANEVWRHLPLEVRKRVRELGIELYTIDAQTIARDAGLGQRINTVMLTAILEVSGLVDPSKARDMARKAAKDMYERHGESVWERNENAIDKTEGAIERVNIPEIEISLDEPAVTVDALYESGPRFDATNGRPSTERTFIDRVTSVLIAGMGNHLPVSAMPVDGTFLVGTSRLEKRGIAEEIPIWNPDLCIQCGLCAFVCPHAAIRMKVAKQGARSNAPSGFPSRPWKGKELPDHDVTIQVAPDDCTGCGVCVDVCPARDKQNACVKAIVMQPRREHLEREGRHFDFFLGLAEVDRSKVAHDGVKGSQLLEPLFEYSGACAGCGETPYLKLITQLFGDRMIIANATGCSSIYGGNLPTTPWTKNREGRGPAWSNSLFEDNAEFGLGLRLAIDRLEAHARGLLERLAPRVGIEFARTILSATQHDEVEIEAQRARLARLANILSTIDLPDAHDLEAAARALLRHSVWIIGGDGWAYDIGFGGLDHVLACGRDVNILVLDTEVYSNTGGQASKATPLGAVAKFASGGKSSPKKDLGMIAMAHSGVYVATIALGAQPAQAIRALIEAEAHRGPSIVIAYSHCIAHGIDMRTSMTHQKDAVKSGYWPLYRHDPQSEEVLHLDSREPSIPLERFAMQEARFAMLARSKPQVATELITRARANIDARFKHYRYLAAEKPGGGAS